MKSNVHEAIIDLGRMVRLGGPAKGRRVSQGLNMHCLVRIALATTFLIGIALYASDAPSVQYAVIKSRVSETTRYQTTIIKVSPPASPIARRPAATQLIGSVERVSNKRYESIMVSAYVHVGGETFTEIKWRDPEAETEYAAWSNVDFRLLVDPATLETETLVFFWFPFVMAFPAEASDTAHPAGLAASGTPDYVLIGKAAELPSEHPLLQALDAVHAHVQLNREALEKRQHERQFQADEAERLLTAASQTKKTVTLRFWPLPRRNAP